MIDLKQSVQYIKGVGPSRAKLLSLLGVNTVEDLINYYPRTYEDRTKIKKIENRVSSWILFFSKIKISLYYAKNLQMIFEGFYISIDFPNYEKRNL